MKKEDYTAKFDLIIAEIEKAEEEICRPLEDVVSLSVCFKVRNSIKEILKLYLDIISVKYSNDSNLEQLFALCDANGKRFDTVEISKVYCKNDNDISCGENCCIGVNEVADCTKVAKQLSEVILKNIKK